jgi:hypothetical protein
MFKLVVDLVNVGKKSVPKVPVTWRALLRQAILKSPGKNKLVFPRGFVNGKGSAT